MSAELEEMTALAARIPALGPGPFTVSRLAGGLTNRNYRIDSPAGSFVLRLADPATAHLGIDRSREVQCCQAVASLGLGPSVVAHLPQFGALITRFVSGRTLAEGDTRRRDLLARVAQTLRAVHTAPVPADLGRFSPFATIRAYHERARALGVPLPRQTESALHRLDTLEADLRTDEPDCLCHNDLLPGNFLDAGTSIQIIDWEYGGLGDRYFDLGNFAVDHQLDESGEVLLLEGCGEPPNDHTLARLRRMRLVSDLREAMWGFLQAGVSTLETPAYYLGYGTRHLERFLECKHGR